jgi:hypothetical protein
MKRLIQTLPLLLAALLQLMPLLRNIVANPANASTAAFIFRWGIGTGAAVGAYDTVSGATNYFTSTNTLTFTNGVYGSNNITVFTNGSDTGAYFILSNAITHIASGQIIANRTTNIFLPAGLTFKTIDLNNGNNPTKPFYGTIYGIPTVVASTNFQIWAGYQTTIMRSNVTINVIAGATLPGITSQPAGITNVAGDSASFSVTASGTGLGYQWWFASASISGANASSLNLSPIRASQAGNYTVVITNSAGAVTSSVAVLGVTNPLPPVITSSAKNGGGFQFTFVPVVGLTNTVLANGMVNSGAWSTFSNVPPPASSSPVTVTDAISVSNRFYRVVVQP